MGKGEDEKTSPFHPGRDLDVRAKKRRQQPTLPPHKARTHEGRKVKGGGGEVMFDERCPPGQGFSLRYRFWSPEEKQTCPFELE